MKSESYIHKPLSKLSAKQESVYPEEVSDTEEGVIEMRTPLINSEPKTISRDIKSKVYQRITKGRTRYLTKPFQINL